MSYALLSDDLMLRLEAAGISRDARLLHVEAIVYCATALTDGELRIRLARISDSPDPDAAAAELVAAGLWERAADGFVVVGYLDQQRSRERVERDREANRKRQDDYRERGRLHASGDHSICTKSCPSKGRNGVTNGVSNGPQSSPLRSKERRERKGEPDVALGRSADSPDIAERGHGFDGDADTPSCNTCGLPKGNGRHGYLPPEVERVVGAIKARGGQLVDASYCPADGTGDDDDFARWDVQATLGDLTVHCEAMDSDPFTFGRLHEVLVQFPCTEAQASDIRSAARKWPATEVSYQERGHCNVVTQAGGADLLSSLPAIVDRSLELHRQLVAA
ncbi:MAG: hypothetical protein Q8M17_16200 [Actinomycetota bacterium]|nr:hypothetical protein [Actinomycetota bacterium]